jgi:hypothetical protein
MGGVNPSPQWNGCLDCAQSALPKPRHDEGAISGFWPSLQDHKSNLMNVHAKCRKFPAAVTAGGGQKSTSLTRTNEEYD